MHSRVWKAVAKCAAQDQTRYQLYGVWRFPPRIEGRQETRLVATDGRKLVDVTVPERDAGDGHPIPVPTFKLLFAGDWRARNGTFSSDKGAEVPIPGPEDDGGIEGEFPEYEGILKGLRAKPVQANVRLDADHLADLCRLAKAVAQENGDKRATIRITIRGEKDAVSLTGDGPKSTESSLYRWDAVLMPVAPRRDT